MTLDAAAQAWTLEWAHGSAQVHALGGMLAPVRLRTGASMLDVMHMAPWCGSPASAALPGLMRGLRGEWPCIPFGRADSPALPAHWSSLQADDGWDHGYAANHLWRCVDHGPGHVRLRIDYPAGSAVAGMERTIRADAGAAALDVELSVSVRRPVRLPIGLHPTFRLPPAPGRVELLLGQHDGIYSYPINPGAAHSRLLPDMRSDSLARMQADGGLLDLSRLPLAGPQEELLQVRAPVADGVRAPFALHYLDERACVGLWWDSAHLPDLMLWVSNGGRTHFPWDGRHVALGAEPVNSLFDLGRVASAPPGHPLADRLGVQLAPGQPWRTSYRIAAWATDGQSA